MAKVRLETNHLVSWAIGWRTYKHTFKEIVANKLDWVGIMLAFAMSFFLLLIVAYFLNILHSYFLTI